MSFFRRLSFRRRSSNSGRSKSWDPPPTNLEERSLGGRPPTHEGLLGAAPEHHLSTVDVYEDRIDDLGRLLSDQGRCLDELTNRSRVLSTENSMLRERLSKSVTAVVPSPTRSPLKNVMNSQKSSNNNEQSKQIIQKYKEENSILTQQAELLANELTDTNKLISDRDDSIASLGRELSSCLEKARLLMIEKKTWKSDMMHKMKEIETLETNAKRSSTAQAELSQKAEVLLSQRKELEAEVTDIGSQMSHLSTKVEDLHSQLVSKQRDVDSLSDKLNEKQQATSLAKHEAKMNSETALALREQLRRTKKQNDLLETKLSAIGNQLADSQISQHQLQIVNDGLQVENKALQKKHKAQISSWTTGQNKVVATLKEQHLAETQSQQKLVDSLRRTNSSLENDSAQLKREFQSTQQRCSSLTKLLASNEKEHRANLDEMISRASEAESLLENSQIRQKELKSEVSLLTENLATLQAETKDKDDCYNKDVERMQKELLAMKEQNQVLSTEISQLQVEVQQTQQDCSKDMQKLEQTAEHKVKDVTIECEALRAAKEASEKLAEERDDLMEKQSLLHQSTLDQLTAEKKELATKMETAITEEREVAASLIAKVGQLKEELVSSVAEKLRMKQQGLARDDKIYTLENIVASGEVKLTSFAKQLARSMDEQERRIMKEVELKKELNTARSELEKLRKG